MAKTITETAYGGQKYFPLPIHDGTTATAKVNEVNASIASQNSQSITLTTAAAQDDDVEITFNPVDQYGQGRTETFVPVTQDTISPTSACGLAIITPAGTLAELTIKFPSGPSEGQFFSVYTSKELTAVTWDNGTEVGGPAGLTAGESLTFQYSTITGKWYKID